MAEEKLKILYLMQILLEETDPAHPLNEVDIGTADDKNTFFDHDKFSCIKIM